MREIPFRRVLLMTGGLLSACLLDAAPLPARSEPLSLQVEVNRGYQDEKAADGGGGWTDEGPGLDLTGFAPGKISVGQVDFNTIDPAANKGLSCLVLSGPGNEALPKSISIPVANGPEWRNLYLLHASARASAENTGESTLVGKVIVSYTDGKVQETPILLGRDVGDWTAPDYLPNGAIAWRKDDGKGGSARGLFASQIPLSGAAVAGITLESSGAAVWMVVGLTGSPDNLALPKEARSIIQAGNDWVPYEQKLEILEGGVFDQSALNDAPAGKYGPIIITPEGHFAFKDRPGVRARFWGVNTSFDVNFPTREDADKLADRLARSGYNSLRLHHFDGLLLRKDATSASDLDPEQLDRLDYFFAALKKRGLYLNIGLFSANRKFSQQDVPELGIDPGPRRLISRLVPVSENAFQAWARFATNLLTHKNPYTGLTWAEDPALIGICPFNEDTIYEINKSEVKEMRALYAEAFAKWKSRPGNERRPEESDNGYQLRFLTDTSVRSQKKLADFLHSLGVTAPITGSNFRSSQAMTLIRAGYDYVENHDYWNHPKFPVNKWAPPVQFNQQSSLVTNCWLPRNMMPSRIFGKPFVVTEFNYVWPNAYRSEGGALLSAYSQLQDWDALYSFGYAEAAKRAFAIAPGRIFEIATDPINLLADRFGALMFRRDEISAAPAAFAFAVEEKDAFTGSLVSPKEFPRSFSSLGFVSRIGSLPGSPSTLADSPSMGAYGLSAIVSGGSERAADGVFTAGPSLASELMKDGKLPADSVQGSRFTSPGGAIQLDTKSGILIVRTDRSEGFVLPAGQSLTGRLVRVKNGGVFSSVYITAVDGNPLAESARLLVLHLTDSLNTGTEFRDSKHTLLEKWGTLPHLVRKGDAEVSLKLGEGTWKAWAVDATGARLREVPLEQREGMWILKADTGAKEGAVLAYELARS